MAESRNVLFTADCAISRKKQECFLTLLNFSQVSPGQNAALCIKGNLLNSSHCKSPLYNKLPTGSPKIMFQTLVSYWCSTDGLEWNYFKIKMSEFELLENKEAILRHVESCKPRLRRWKLRIFEDETNLELSRRRQQILDKFYKFWKG